MFLNRYLAVAVICGMTAIGCSSTTIRSQLQNTDRPLPGAERNYSSYDHGRQVIADAIKKAIAREGYKLTGERDEDMYQVTYPIPGKEYPVIGNIKFSGENRVHILFYNIDAAESEARSKKLFAAIGKFLD